jgi:hypothetical protein
MRDLLVWGVGELGRWLGGAALRAGLRVTPLTRDGSPQEILAALPTETPLLVAVGEDALDGVLAAVPHARAQDVVLLQNELFPAQWRARGIEPSVMVPWLLKKRGEPELVGRPSRLYGKHVGLLGALHDVLGVPWVRIDDGAALPQALVDKYTFILTINALGLLKDRTLGGWLREDPRRVDALAREAAQVGALRCEAAIDAHQSVVATLEAMGVMAGISARGRTARARFERGLRIAREHGLGVPELAKIEAGLSS